MIRKSPEENIETEQQSAESLLLDLKKRVKKIKKRKIENTVSLPPLDSISVPDGSIYYSVWDPSQDLTIPNSDITCSSTEALDNLSKLHDICFLSTKDKLPREFIIDVVTRKTGVLVIAYMDTNIVKQHAPTDYLPCTSSITVLGGLLMLDLVHWSKFKDTEFQLRRIGNIFSVFVDPHFRGKGIAGSLLDFSAELCRMKGHDEIAIEVRATNTGAYHLYKKKGFVTQYTEADYYEYGATRADRKCYEMAMAVNDYQTDPDYTSHKQYMLFGNNL